MATRLSPSLHARPAESRIESAKRAIPEILLDQPAVDAGVVEISSDRLIAELRKIGHPLAVAEHAIFDLADAGFLEPHWARWEPPYPVSERLLATAAKYEESMAPIDSGVILTAKEGLWKTQFDDQPPSTDTTKNAGPKSAEPQLRQLLADLLDEALMNHVDLAKTLRLDCEALRKRLERWRAKNMEGWQQVHEPTSREPKYLYRIGAIRELLEAAIASAESSG